MPNSTARLVEKSVDGNALQRIFRGAFLETEAINERAVRVSLDGVRYQVVAEPDRKLLIYLTHFRFRSDVNTDESTS